MNSYTIAVYIKYYLQFKNNRIINKKNPNQIAAKTFYNKYKIIFNKAFEIFKKYDLDLIRYIEFYITKLDKYEKDIKIDFLSYNNIVKYLDYLKSIENYKRIYNYFLKSMKNVAEDALKLGYFSTKDYLKYLIKDKKIAAYYISGKISKYYFASIPKFKLIIGKLDNFSKNDLNDIYNKYEKYNADITLAYQYFKSQTINPFVLTDNLIFKMKQNGINN